MDNSHVHGFQSHIDQAVSDSYYFPDDDECTVHNDSSSEIGTQHLFEQSHGTNILSAYYRIENSNVSNNLSLYKIFIQYGLDIECESSLNIKSIAEVCDYNFFQLYAIKKGYSLTTDFLSSVNKHKICFIDVIDTVLSTLDGDFNFSRDFHDEDGINLEDEICYFFYKHKINLESNCINILQSDFMPAVIESIFENKVSYCGDSSESEMRYCEMESFFLYFVSVLERVIIIKTTDYWTNFFDRNRSLLSTIPNIDHSNHLCNICPNDKLGVLGFTHPFSFCAKFGACISFISISKIDDIVSGFIDELSLLLKSFVNSRCEDIYDSSFDVSGDLKKLRSGLSSLIEEELDKDITERSISNYFDDFLIEIIMCNQHDFGSEVNVMNRLLLRDEIINCMRILVSDRVIDDACSIVNKFLCRLEVSRSIVLRNRSFERIKKYSLLSKLHPEDSGSILLIKKKFSSVISSVIKDKFCKMLYEKHMFSDGTVVSDVAWGKISKKILPIIQEEIRPFINEERKEIYRILSKARMVEDDNKFCNSLDFVGCVREATSDEKYQAMEISNRYVDVHIKTLFRRSWYSLINDMKKVYDLGCIKFADRTKEASSNVVDDSSVLTDCSESFERVESSLPIDLVYASSGVRLDKVVSRWGLNIHPDDENEILFMRRKFSNDIRVYVWGMFSYMLGRKYALPDGSVLSERPWCAVSCYLLPIALRSIDPILKRQYLELDNILSKSRVVIVSADDCSSCVFRRVTDAEINGLRIIAKKRIEKELRKSISRSWLCALGTARSNIGYSAVELFTGMSLGANIRHKDNVDLLNIRNGFLSKIGKVVYGIFCEALNDENIIEKYGVIDIRSWSEVSSILLPIARKGIKSILDSEHRFMEDILSRAHVVVDCIRDRKITDEEKLVVLENVKRLVNIESMSLIRSVWSNLVGEPEQKYLGLNVRTEDDGYLYANCVEDVSSTVMVGKSIPDKFVKFGSLYLDKDYVKTIEVKIKNNVDVTRKAISNITNRVDKGSYPAVSFYEIENMTVMNFRVVSERMVSEFMDELGCFFSDAVIWDNCFRVIDDAEKCNLLRYVYAYVSIQHDQIIFNARSALFLRVVMDKRV
ncbi:hypothetical protein [Candidatus Ichthyocystis hellenicum]|uniref:hypothetical protein n=1 Tax=Candidatus Ichthyocystis hellenicum TaxID=1561003 RepID=UPI000B80AE1A|nr:hypothetical protein [Candidatus Ichthyocystis hellenicum]